MSENEVRQLPSETVKLITSAQVVTSVSTAVKELLENSIDAGAKIIQVRLDNYGLDLIEVKDNGVGASYDNVQKMFLPGCTSKIKQFDDLDKLTTYGFRGEALAAMCKISKVSITTKTGQDTVAMTYEIDSSGQPLMSKPSHLGNGTTIVITGLFSNLPVRKLFMTSKKRMSEELKRTEHVVQSTSLIHPDLNVSLVHNKSVIWKKNSVRGLKQSFMQVVSLKTVSKMDQINKSVTDVNIELLVPKKNLDSVENVFTNSTHHSYLYVNKRPVACKKLSQTVQEHIFHHYANSNVQQKHALCLIAIDVPSQEVDINLEPNKTRVLLRNEPHLIRLLDEALANYYGNANFHSTAFKALVAEEESLAESEPLSPSMFNDDMPLEPKAVKRPRLDMGTKVDVASKSGDASGGKDGEWTLKIVDVQVPPSDIQVDTSLPVGVPGESAQSRPTASSLCSQINRENCTLTTDEEVTRLNAIFSDNNFNAVTCANSKNSLTRLVERNELQAQAHPVQSRVLPEWPTRQPGDVVQQPSSQGPRPEPVTIVSTETVIQPESSKSAEEIATEMATDVDKWSADMLAAMKVEKATEDDGQDELKYSQSVNFNLSMESVSSQMGKKEMKAFTKFARIMRPKIVQEFPKLVFTQVASILVERWRALTPTEVKYYEKMADVVDLNRKIYQEQKIASEAGSKESGSVKDANLNLLFERIKKKNKANRPVRRERTVTTSLTQVRGLMPGQTSPDVVDTTDYQLLGRLEPSGNWLYLKGKEIGHVRHLGLQEVILYQRMMSSHEVPRKSVDKPIFISEEKLGAALWRVLTSLPSSFRSEAERYVMVSEVITKNGFRIEIAKTNNVATRGYITEVAEPIPQYGLSDLKEVLLLYLKTGEGGCLASWRPTSVDSYFRNEAIRLTQAEDSRRLERHEIEDMLNTYHLCLTHLDPVCLHSRPIFQSIHHIQD